MKTTILAPWYTYRNKLAALFREDPDIIVGDVVNSADGDGSVCVPVSVSNHEKYIALDRAMAKAKDFGNIHLTVLLIDATRDNGSDNAELYDTIFRGNPLLKDVREVTDPAGAIHGYVRFEPTVVQFFNDDISDYNGNWSGLAQDIAREVFDSSAGIHFCTADVRENVVDTRGKNDNG